MPRGNPYFRVDANGLIRTNTDVRVSPVELFCALLAFRFLSNN